jgi:hypothetical protein
MSRRGGGGRGRGGSKSTLSSSKELLKRSANEAGLDDRHIKVLSDITRPPLFPDFLWKSSGHYWNEEEDAALKTQDLLQQHPVKTETTTTPPSSTTNKKLPASMISLIHKQRELTKRFQYSSYYIRPTTTVDIVRYSDRVDNNKNPMQHRSPDATILASLSTHSTNSSSKNTPFIAVTKYFPEEILPMKKKNSRRQNQHSTGSLTPIRKSETTTANEVAIKLETLDHQEESGKLRTTSITSLTSTDDLMMTVPLPLHMKDRKSSEADETILGEIDDEDEDDDNNNDILEENVEEELVEDYTTNYYASEDDNNDDNNDDDGEPTY